MTLSETWFMEGNIDFESKKYTLLAYLQRINAYFNESKLYPHLSDIIFHYQFKPKPAYTFVSSSVKEILGYTPQNFYKDPLIGYKF